MIGDEPYAPYQRPPLSKKFLPESDGEAGLPGVETPRTLPGNEHVWHLYVVRVTFADPSLRSFPEPRPAGHLCEQLEGALRGTEIRDVERRIGGDRPVPSEVRAARRAAVGSGARGRAAPRARYAGSRGDRRSRGRPCRCEGFATGPSAGPLPAACPPRRAWCTAASSRGMSGRSAQEAVPVWQQSTVSRTSASPPYSRGRKPSLATSGGIGMHRGT